jgi:nucleoside-diphosphate-sugar epimerase
MGAESWPCSGEWYVIVQTDAWAKRRVLVTGGMGFIGSTLAIRLAELGADVTVLDSLTPEYGGNPANLAGYEGRIRVNISDVRDVHSLKYLVQGQQVLFNLAGQTSHLDSMQDPFTDLEINCRAQLSILETCRTHNPELRLVFASTRQLYGRPDYLPVDEKHPLRPVDVNGINKLSGEFYHLLYQQVYGIPTTVLRLTNTFGPRMRIRDARQTFVGIWIRRILEGQPFEVWGGEQLRDFTYVDDCVDAMLLAATRPQAVGRCYNLGGMTPVSLATLAERLVLVNGSGQFVRRDFPADRKKIDIGDFYSDDQMIRDELGWNPVTDLDQALSRTLEYYRTRLDLYI